MAALDVPVRTYKVYAGLVGERVGRLKLNGRLLARSPLSSLEELELLSLGVTGKAAGWRTLRLLAERIRGWTAVGWTSSSPGLTASLSSRRPTGARRAGDTRPRAAAGG